VSIGAPPDPFNAAGQDWGLPPFIPWRLRAAQYAPFIALVRAACRHMGGLRIDHVMGLFRQFWVPAGGSPAEGAYVHLPAHEMLAIIRIEATRAGTFVIGEDLGAAPAGKAYELWLITPSASMAMHVLDPASDGNVHASFDMPQAPAKWAITVEPESGTEVATGDIIFIGSVA
jgi:hypothetical protein